MIVIVNNFVGRFIRWIRDILSKGGATIFKGANLWSKGLSKLSPQKFEHYREPIARQSYCVSSRLPSRVSGYCAAHEAIGHSAPIPSHADYSAVRNSLLIGLPPSSKDQKKPVVMEECIKKDMTAQELIEELALKFRVNNDKWVLVVVSNEKAPYVLDKRDKLEEFITSKTERLYFYPEFVVRR